MPKHFFLLLLFFFASTLCLQAQSRDFLLLKRGSNQKAQIRYYVGENITYKSKKIGYFITDKIVGFDKDFVQMSENIISPEDILEIDIRDKDRRNRTMKSLTGLFLGAGTILLGVESINSIYHEGQLSVDSGVAIVSGALIGTGLALIPVRYKTFEQKPGNRIQIILMRMD